MDTATLVNERIDAGKAFVNHLKASGFDVVVAFWVLTSEDSLWFLYIGSSVVDKDGLAEAYGKVYRELGKSQVSGISRSEIKLIGRTNPLTLDAIANQRDKLPTKYSGRKLGSVIIEEAYIYPK